MSDVNYQDLQDDPEEELEEIETDEIEEDGDPDPEPQSDPEIEKEAVKWGWTPKDQWKGEPDEHRSAEEYMNDARTQRRIRETSEQRFQEQEAKHREQMEAMRRTMEVANKRIADVEKGGHQRDVAELQRQIEVAAENGDVAEVRRLTGELTKIPAPKTEPEQKSEEGTHPDIAAFNAANPWLDRVPGARNEMIAYCESIQSESPAMTPGQVLERALERYKERNPRVFGITNGSGQSKQTRERPQKVAGSEARGSGGGGGERGFSTIPAADRAAAKSMIGKGKLFANEAEYAKDYWTHYGE